MRGDRLISVGQSNHQRCRNRQKLQTSTMAQIYGSACIETIHPANAHKFFQSGQNMTVQAATSLEPEKMTLTRSALTHTSVLRGATSIPQCFRLFWNADSWSDGNYCFGTWNSTLSSLGFPRRIDCRSELGGKCWERRRIVCPTTGNQKNYEEKASSRGETSLVQMTRSKRRPTNSQKYKIRKKERKTVKPR